MSIQLETANPLFGKYLYPEAKEIMEKQQNVFWTAQEIDVAGDIHDYLHNMSSEQFALVSTTLQLFVETEQVVGDIWSVIAEWFPHSEIEGACTQVAAMEKSVHAFFYQKMSDELNIDPETIANNQNVVRQLNEKLTMLTTIMQNARKATTHKERLMVLFTVSNIEQVTLFSNFAMLKSFRANGNSLIPNTITGVNFVVQDESIHGVLASYLFNTLKDEAGVTMTLEDVQPIVDEILLREDAVVDYLFTSDEMKINGIDRVALKRFIRERVNFVCSEMHFPPATPIVEQSSISGWFFSGVNAITIHDFFVSGTHQYKRTWSESRLSRLPYVKGDNI